MDITLEVMESLTSMDENELNKSIQSLLGEGTEFDDLSNDQFSINDLSKDDLIKWIQGGDDQSISLDDFYDSDNDLLDISNLLY